ncbi:MAG: YidH family protein [Ktedonobacterales bacterium]
MPSESGQPGSDDTEHVREHLANERTLLAWARTGIAVMALGFVVARFGLLVRELGPGVRHVFPLGTSTFFGTALVICGTVLMALSLVRYQRIARAISTGTFRASPALGVVLAVILVASGVLLAVYLLVSA